MRGRSKDERDSKKTPLEGFGTATYVSRVSREQTSFVSIHHMRDRIPFSRSAVPASMDASGAEASRSRQPQAALALGRGGPGRAPPVDAALRAWFGIVLATANNAFQHTANSLSGAAKEQKAIVEADDAFRKQRNILLSKHKSDYGIYLPETKAKGGTR